MIVKLLLTLMLIIFVRNQVIGAAACLGINAIFAGALVSVLHTLLCSDGSQASISLSLCIQLPFDFVSAAAADTVHGQMRPSHVILAGISFKTKPFIEDSADWMDISARACGFLTLVFALVAMPQVTNLSDVSRSPAGDCRMLLHVLEPQSYEWNVSFARRWLG